jgi:hypothetical protein
VAVAPGFAADLNVKVTLPTIAQSGARPPTRPYVAIWLRRADNTPVADLAVWYQLQDRQKRGFAPGGEGERGGGPGGPGGPGAQGGDRGGGGPPAGAQAGGRQEGGDPPAIHSSKDPGGARWLNGVRDWWADSGNNLQFPVDGLTTASRPAGTYELTFAGNDPKLAKLAPGQYKLMVEAAREHGGNETVSVPFTWPVKAAQSAHASGRSELGDVELSLKP